MPTAWLAGMIISADRLLGDFRDWENLPIKSPASDGTPGQSLHRIKRHPDGQVEIQLDVSVSTSTSASIATLPTWARPSSGTRRNATALNSSNAAFNAHIDLTAAGDVNLFAVTTNMSSITWVALHTTYTP
ncbi:hypothetical protein ACIO3R_32370 [Streptomyces sp. NPDC087428]|uniref:hypothetical protein n=1 Tax=Streptomyces sp. NPDC087428 TaxID=3365788 RepID=UPI00381763F5